MKYENLNSKYQELEYEVMQALRSEIENSQYNSKTHSYTKAIKVNVFDYTELIIIQGNLTFLNEGGYHYSIYAECDLEDLIDILNQID